MKCVHATYTAEVRRMNDLRINSSRLNDNIQQLGEVGSTSDGAVSRVSFSDADLLGREYVIGLMRGAALGVSVDTVGNIFGRCEGSEEALPPILLGSHTDTVPNGGFYDGALGVLAALEVAQTLKERTYPHRHPIDVVVWADEEGGLSGSRGFIGTLPSSELDRVVAGGMTLGEGIERLGGNPGRIEDAKYRNGAVAAYLELHVEQGAILESQNINIGVVSGIVGICHYCVTFSGTANHAGTTTMDQRQNALLAASEFVLK